MRGLSPNFHIHASEIDLYSQDRSTYFPAGRRGGPIAELYKSLTQHMNVETGTEASPFLFCGFLDRIFGIMSLQCIFTH